MPWKPISSAPRDGRILLGRHEPFVDFVLPGWWMADRRVWSVRLIWGCDPTHWCDLEPVPMSVRSHMPGMVLLEVPTDAIMVPPMLLRRGGGSS